MMTQEEAIKTIEFAKTYISKDGMIRQALELALSALRPVSREQVDKVWNGCAYCMNDICSLLNWKYGLDYVLPNYKFCPMCGRPLTDEAVQIVMERLEALHEQTKAD